MYLENPKRLFKDLYNIHTMQGYMVACEEDGEDENLSNLVSIVGCNRGEVHYGGEGSCRWDLEQYDNEEQRQQVIKDSRMIDAIYKQILKEINAKYVIQCGKCGYAWFTNRNTKCVKALREDNGEKKSDWKCFCKGQLHLYTMEEWCLAEGIDLKEVMRYA